MLGSIIGAVIGNRFDRADGRGGLKGALGGALATGAMRRLGPLGLVLGGAYAAKKIVDGQRARRLNNI